MNYDKIAMLLCSPIKDNQLIAREQMRNINTPKELIRFIRELGAPLEDLFREHHFIKEVVFKFYFDDFYIVFDKATDKDDFICDCLIYFDIESENPPLPLRVDGLCEDFTGYAISLCKHFIYFLKNNNA